MAFQRTKVVEIVRSISYIQLSNRRLEKFIDYIDQAAAGMEVGQINLLRFVAGWEKPYFLVFDSLFLSDSVQGKRVRATVFALQSVDTKSFKVIYVSLSEKEKARSLFMIYQYIEEQLKNIGIINLMVAIVCDRNPINNDIINYVICIGVVPVLHDYVHIQKILAPYGNKNDILTDLHWDTYRRETYNQQIASFLERNELNSPECKGLVAEEIEKIRRIIVNVFENTNESFSLKNGSTKKLEWMGIRWKYNFKEFCEVDRRTLHVAVGIVALYEEKINT